MRHYVDAGRRAGVSESPPCHRTRLVDLQPFPMTTMKLEPGQLVAEMREGRAWRVRRVRSNDGILVVLDNGARWTAAGSRRAAGHRDEGWTLREITESQRDQLMSDPDVDDARCFDTYALDRRDEKSDDESTDTPFPVLMRATISLLCAAFALMWLTVWLLRVM